MQMQTKWACGNFTIDLSVVVPDESLSAKSKALVAYGIRQIGQRNSEVDKILGAFKVGTDGKAVRIKDWKRNEVPFSPDLAAKLKTSFEGLKYDEITDDGEFAEVSLGATATVTEYVSKTKEVKFESETAAMLRHESKGDLEVWLKDVIGFAGDSHGADGEYNVEALKAIRVYAKTML